MNTNKTRIEELEQEKAQLNPNNTDDQFRIKTIDIEIATLTEQVRKEEQGTSGTRTYDFDADFNAAFGATFLNDAIQDIIDAVRAGVHTRYQEQLEEREQANRELTAKCEQLNEQNSKLIEAKNQAILERNDFEAKYNAATDLLKDKDVELEGKEMVIKAKQEQIDALNRQLAEAPAPSAAKVINATGTNIDTNWLKEKIANDQAKKPKIYDVKPLDFKGSVYGAVDEQGNPIEIKHLDLGKYNIQESPFRQMATDMVQEAAENSNVTGEQFPSIEAPSIPAMATGLDSGATGTVREGGETEATPVTRAEFEEFRAEFAELKGKVAALEVGKGAVA